jgi:acyl-coenzyme A synthetase/AMP-(fatty) acid ligase
MDSVNRCSLSSTDQLWLLCSDNRIGNVSGFRDFARKRSLNYRDFLGGVTRTANILGRLGIGDHDVVAPLLPNLPEMHLALMQAEAAGMVMPLNPYLEAKAIAALLTAAKAKLLITLGSAPAFVETMLDAVAAALTVGNDDTIVAPDLVYQAGVIGAILPDGQA